MKFTFILPTSALFYEHHGKKHVPLFENNSFTRNTVLKIGMG
jgi:hypothetical protein